MASFGFVSRRAGHGLRQHCATVALTSLTIALTLSVFGGMLLLQINLQKIARGWSDVQLTAYLAPSVGAAELAALQSRLQSFAEIERVHHISQDQAWRDFQAALGAQSALLDGLPRDVLPASLEITLRPEFRDAVTMEPLAARLKQQQEITQLDYPQRWVERLGLALSALRWLKWLVAGVLVLASFFIVSNMIRLALLARRDEIALLQWLGASEALIQTPLALEGAVQGLLGGAGGLGLLWGVYRLLRDDPAGLAELLPALALIEFLDAMSIALIVAIGILLGASASLFASRGMIRSWKASTAQ